MKRPAQIAAAVIAFCSLAATPDFWFTAEPPAKWKAPGYWKRETKLCNALGELELKGLLNNSDAVEARGYMAELEEMWSRQGAPPQWTSELSACRAAGK